MDFLLCFLVVLNQMIESVSPLLVIWGHLLILVILILRDVIQMREEGFLERIEIHTSRWLTVASCKSVSLEEEVF